MILFEDQTGATEIFLKKKIHNILQGKENKSLKEAGYQTLSTYGLLGDISRIQLEHMVNILIARGYLRMDTSQYATLSLAGAAVKDVFSYGPQDSKPTGLARRKRHYLWLLQKPDDPPIQMTTYSYPNR